MVPMMKNFLRKQIIRQNAAFTIIEILVVIAILAVISSLAFASGSRSLERSKIDAVAIELAGWLTAVHANNDNDNAEASAGCYVDYVAASDKSATAVSTTAIDHTFSAGDVVFAIRDPANCFAASSSFRMPSNVGSGYQMRIYSPIIFSVRGTMALAGNDAAASNASDIKIYNANTGLLRCIRVYYLIATVEIGSKSNAGSLDDQCSSFDAF